MMNTRHIRFFLRLVLYTAMCLLCSLQVMAQQPHKKKHRISRIDLKKMEDKLFADTALLKKYEDLSFYYQQDYAPKVGTPKQESLKFEGYIDTYYAWYSDSMGVDQLQKFPTSAPKHNQFGLNMVMVSAKYQHDKTRGMIALHYGDIASSAWSPVYNLIQEAHVGVRIFRKVWVDAGFFRTHLGFESIQPRENLTTSIATTTFYEPYFLSGAKLTWYATAKLTLMAAAFNGFNNYNDNNNDKTLGFTVNYDFTSSFFISLNSLYGNEMPKGTPAKMRSYTDLYFGYRSNKLDIGGEINYGLQQKSKLTDSTATAEMFSALLAIKYKMLNQRFACYVRGEYFSDQNEILTGPVINDMKHPIGLNIAGATLGFELKPIGNTFIRFEHRTLQTLGSDEKIFLNNHEYTNRRLEFSASMGVWF